MNENLPFLWRRYFRNEAISSEKVLEITHEQARQYLSRGRLGGTESDATK